MRRSQIALLTGVGVVAIGIVALAAFLRIALSSFAADADVRAAERPLALNMPAEELTGFTRLVIRDSWEVDIRQGDDWRVELAVPDNRRADLAVRVEDGQLVLDSQGGGGGWQWSWFGNPDRLGAEIVVPRLDEIAVEGSADIDLDAFDGAALAVGVSGALNMQARGSRFERLSLELSGASNVDFSAAPVVDVDVQLSGASNVILDMDGGRLTGTLAGFGNVVYSGAVSEESVAVSGFGRVSRQD